MRSAFSNHRSRNQIARRYLRRLIVLALCVLCVSVSTSLAQSGRRQTQTEAKTDSAKSSRSETNDKKVNQSTPDFIVITAPPDILPDYMLYSGYSQPSKFESLARRGCQLELKKLIGTNVIEDEGVERWEARETALTEDKTWVIWMELKWETTTITVNPTQFRLRYLLFEPGTGKLVASGFGKGIKQTWGMPQRSATLEEQLQEAGRNIADQALFEIRKRAEN